MTRNIDDRRLGQLRQGQGEIANHIIDEFAAGRLSRRDFIRRGTVVGISVPLLGSILAACGSSGTSSAPSGGSTATGKAGAVIKAGIITPTGAINPVTVADHGGPADEVAAGKPPRGELVDDVVSDLALAPAQAPEPAVVDIPGHAEPPCDGADSLRWRIRSSAIGI